MINYNYLLIGLVWGILLRFNQNDLNSVFGGTQVIFVVIPSLLFISFLKNKFIKKICFLFSYLLLLLSSEMILYHYELFLLIPNAFVQFGNILFMLLLYFIMLFGLVLTMKKDTLKMDNLRSFKKNVVTTFGFPYLLIVVLYCFPIIFGTNLLRKELHLWGQPLYSFATLFFAFVGLVTGTFYLAGFLKNIDVRLYLKREFLDMTIGRKKALIFWSIFMILGLLLEILRGNWLSTSLALLIPLGVLMCLGQLLVVNKLSDNNFPKAIRVVEITECWKFIIVNLLFSLCFYMCVIFFL